MDQLSDKVDDDDDEDFNYGDNFTPQTVYTWPTESEQCLFHSRLISQSLSMSLDHFVSQTESPLISYSVVTLHNN